MAGPWEKYASDPAPDAPASGPWLKYAQPAPEPVAAPAPAPEERGVIGRAIDKMFPKYGIAAALANGVTFGGVPLAQAAAAAGYQGVTNAVGAGGPSMSDTFHRVLDEQQKARQGFREAHPIVNATAEAVGGVASGTALAKNGVTLVGRMPNEGLSNLLPRTAASAVEGGLYAGTAGFVGSEGSIQDRARHAANNLPLGVAVGAAAPAVIDAVKGGFSAARNAYVGMRDPAKRGDEILSRSLVRDKQTPEDLAQALEAASKAGQPEYRAVDAAGKNTQRAGALAAKTPGPFRNDVSEALATRQQGQGDRIKSNLSDAIGDGSSAYQTEQDMIAARRAAADPAYDRAYAQPAPTGPVYDDLAQKRSVQDAMRIVERTAAENNRPMSDLFTDVPNPNPTTRQVPSAILGPDGQPIMRSEVVDPTVRVPTMRGWDQTKRALDKQVDTGFNSTDAAQKYQADAVKETRNTLRAQLASDNPAYGDALQHYADDTASLEALQTGRDFAKASNPDEGRALFTALSPGDQQLARTGASRELGNKIDSLPPGNDKTRAFSTPNMQGKLDTLAQTPEARQLLQERLAREEDMVRASRALTGGSSTAENVFDGTDIGNTGGALAALFSGHPLRAAGLAGGQALAAITRAASGMNEETAKHVGEILMSNDPNRIRNLVDMFQQTVRGANQPSIAPAVVSAGANAPRSGQRRDR